MSSCSSDEPMTDKADEDYDPQEHTKKQARRRKAESRERHPRANQDEETRERSLSQDRRRKAAKRALHPISGEHEHRLASQRKHRYFKSHQGQDVHDEPIPLTLLGPTTTPHRLGPMNNECPYCGALHFVGVHACCQSGHVFVQPFNRIPEPLFSLLFNEHARNKTNFFKNVIGYNSLFSFASYQFDKIPPKKHGAQVAKARGLVRHFSSCVIPNNPSEPQFGNLYVYQGDEAVQKRMENPEFRSTNREVVEELEQCLRDHPMALSYRTMYDLMKEDEANNRNPLQRRMKIMDKYEYEKYQKLKGHKGIYCVPATKDHVSVFFSSDIDQKALPKGLIIYPKLNQSVGTQIFYWSKIVNTLCYPLIFPRGENGWSSGTIRRVNPEPFSERLRRLIYESEYNISAGWDSDEEEPSDPSRHRRRIQMEGDPNLEREDDDPSGDEYDQHYEQSLVLEGHTEEADHGWRFVERGGERYPRRRNEYDGEIDRLEDSDSGDDEDRMEGMEDASEETGQPSAVLLRRPNPYGYNEDSDTDDDINNSQQDIVSTEHGPVEVGHDEAEPTGNNEEQPVGNEEQPEHSSRRKFISLREWALYISQRRKRFRNRITALRKLGQVFVIDLFTRILQSRMRAIEEHCTQFMSTSK